MLSVQINKHVKTIVYSVSIFIGLGLIMFLTFIWPGLDSHPEYDNYLIIAIIITLIPSSIVDFLDRKWKRDVDHNLPKFIRDIADSQKTGMAFTKAIEHSARLDYGALSKELRQTVSLMSWGETYKVAFDEMAKRVNTPLVYRTMALLTEVGHSGGNLGDILESIYLHTKEVQDMQNDRRRQMSTYLMVIYAAFGVYLFVVIILFLTFFAQIQSIAEEGTPFGGNINPIVYYGWFFHMSVIESVFAGFIIGKMGDGSISAGLKHVLVLLIISITVFIFVILPSIG